MALDEAEVRAALMDLALPGGEGPLGASARLGPPRLDGGRLSVAIAVTPAEAAAMEAVRRAAEALLARLPGVERALVALTAERGAAPPDGRPSAPGPGAAPVLAAAEAGPRPIPGVGRILAVASGKGGVGKSTTACNLAVALAARGLAVGVLDADIHGPSMPVLFGLRGRPRVLPDRRLEPMTSFGVRVMSIGFLVEAETAMIWRGPMVLSALTQMLREVAWGRLDVLILDLPPGTGDAPLAMVQSVPLSGAVVVSTPQDLALADVRRGVAMFAKTGVRVLGLVENMAGFVCATCGTATPVFGTDGARREAERLGLPLLGEVPLEMAVRVGADTGRPVAAIDPEGPIGRVYGAIAEAVWRAVER